MAGDECGPGTPAGPPSWWLGAPNMTGAAEAMARPPGGVGIGGGGPGCGAAVLAGGAGAEEAAFFFSNDMIDATCDGFPALVPVGCTPETSTCDSAFVVAGVGACCWGDGWICPRDGDGGAGLAGGSETGCKSLG